MRLSGWLCAFMFLVFGNSAIHAQSNDFLIQTPVEYVYETDLKTQNVLIPIQWETTMPIDETTAVRIQQVITGEYQFEVQIPHVVMWSEGARVTYAAPIFVTGMNELLLRVQFVQNAEILAASDLTIPIRPGGRNIRVTPQVSTFDITSVQPLSSSQERIGVGINWWVDNAPLNANLAFEQILPDGTIRNIEQQRQELQVFAMGEGFGVAQIPFSPTKVIMLRVRLYDLQTGYVYAQDVEATTYSVPTETTAGTVSEQPTTAAENPNPPQSNESNATVVRFEVSPRTVARGEPFTVTWEIAGAQQDGIDGDIRILAVGSDYRGGTALASFLPAAGSASVELPADNPQYLESAQVWVQGGGAVSEQITVQVACPYTPLVGEACPQTSETDAAITYQAFERGFMIAYGDTIIIAQDGGFVLYSGAAADAPPETLTAPAAIFQNAWRSTIEDSTPVYDLLGGATAAAQRYSGTWQRMPNLRSGYQDYATLPDGRVLTVRYSFSRAVQWRIN